jgi:hypothetical protein
MAVAPAGQSLLLKRATLSRPSGQWNDDDYDMLADGAVVGCIFKANAAPVGAPWMWTLAFGHHEHRTADPRYETTREAAMAAFARVGGGNRPALSAVTRGVTPRPNSQSRAGVSL